jgi:uncharacterized protein (DUF488 family)
MTIWTIGHSTRSFDELVALLREHRLSRLADVRRYPCSRRHPHFSRESLEQTLPASGITYLHFEDLGGRRRPEPDSPNGAWQNDQFRAYADYMGTAPFHSAADRLLDSELATVVMCAEAVPWRCHRNLLADELTHRGVEVVHILGAGSIRPHTLSRMARIEGDRVIYPPEQSEMFGPPAG